MLRRITSIDTNGALLGRPDKTAVERILRLDSARLAFLLEFAWQLRLRAPSSTPAQEWLPTLLRLIGPSTSVVAATRGGRLFHFDHLIYAYFIENTRAYEVFSRAVRELLHGERLGILQREDSYRWLRTTEELFLKDASPFQPQALVSRVRPDVRASRRNAYYRMFGMDLNHGADGGGAYPYERSEAANREFVSTFEDLLRQVWRGIENSANTAGANATDPATIADLASQLQQMLNARRGATLSMNLAREEFEFVNTMAWFHLTLLFDTPIVLDLSASATSPQERLRLIGERVGIPVPAKAYSYFNLASATSTLLVQIEAGHYSTSAAATDLYAPPPNPIRDMMASIITHWSMATGRDLKSPTVSVGVPPPSVAARAPVRVAAAAAAPARGNGAAGAALVSTSP